MQMTSSLSAAEEQARVQFNAKHLLDLWNEPERLPGIHSHSFRTAG